MPPLGEADLPCLRPVLIPIHLRQYGPQNFLWLSDIAPFATPIAIWTGNRLLASTIAVGVPPLEIVWTADLLAGGQIGLAAYSSTHGCRCTCAPCRFSTCSFQQS